FELAATEVTVAQYGAYARETGSRLPTQPHWSDHDHPVVNLSWNEAAAYCGSIGGRLPTEAEWELAARGGENERYPAGEAFDPEGVNGMSVTGKDRWGFTAPVGSFPANGFGLHDMTGNVWEWTADWYREGPGWTQPTLMDPAPDSASYLKTVRGGSWDSSPRNLRITRREGLSAGGRHNLYVGIRCAR
ncbi:MAG TPA: SUMF1/EgtB/PvdO family nonheme iron enzyme, partial [Vicinamibacterales bacterium]|nr:SUMF1/EgtB/PvdO family nonheme iron enzyme [Vicinamibacterales bacterium]